MNKYVKMFIENFIETVVLFVIFNFVVFVGWFCLCFTPATFNLTQWMGIDSNTTLLYAVQITSPITTFLTIILGLPLSILRGK